MRCPNEDFPLRPALGVFCLNCHVSNLANFMLVHCLLCCQLSVSDGEFSVGCEYGFACIDPNASCFDEDF
ncbi:unnamed protein product, partial [Ectocarpus sp. 4 AP-2014]